MVGLATLRNAGSLRAVPEMRHSAWQLGGIFTCLVANLSLDPAS
jgi:hypothetical protein